MTLRNRAPIDYLPHLPDDISCLRRSRDAVAQVQNDHRDGAGKLNRDSREEPRLPQV